MDGTSFVVIFIFPETHASSLARRVGTVVQKPELAFEVIQAPIPYEYCFETLVEEYFCIKRPSADPRLQLCAVVAILIRIAGILHRIPAVIVE